ncbi:colanic acid biosynthesis protein WcaM [Kosakonia radicincitans DSM 16656]|uniref:colanic acid biosynthesis protein WcaM n=1 Tax=Kosakonia TaxID=1330547 RepID=UPI000272EDC0|nr:MULTISPECIES: colanic acid biosynthesis protein WcaM [Kosakonia]ARD60055.1 colanic acid biosynthesis protein WcaM [Kosakonia radicincitans DSM 16656]KDE34866.1 colanic acid biosynthesis protein [Kosakonia radicincitans UMEnt01/12]MDD7993723.1 colanic acid biosynthesis protein WcaM [Kosakonia radicincitans]NCF05437.1 colanic acid biosynthesis protein WcaM [Kosakonia sp. MH5]PTA91446.1 colanic acid biosynthesis protein WcaM [Kosakonia sp. H7A]
MTAKKASTPLSRRTFLAASSALAALPLLHSPAARALGGKGSVNISDYDHNDWPAALNKAFNEGQTVEIPAGLVCENINTGIFIPPGKTLLIRGTLKSSGRGRFVLQDGSRVIGEKGGSLYNITLDVRGSNCVIQGVSMSGYGPIMQIYIGGKNTGTMRNLLIDNITVSKANYGILRQGYHNQLDGARITNSRFSDLQGDAIEWNVAINDRNILISDHVIKNIDCTNGQINWGIGIGLAGSTYDNNYPEDQAVKNFVVANITGSNCRQLVHVENGKHFIIRNVKAENITPDFSKKAGLDNATIAIYGCDNFVIDNVSMVNSAGMLIGYGVIKGNYLSIPQNFKLNDIQQDNSGSKYKLRGIQISSGNATSFVAITNLKMQHATLELHNKPQHLFLRNINVMQDAANGPALKLNFDMRKDVRGRFMARQDTLLSLANIHAVNENGQSSVDIDRVDQHVVNVDNLNFRLPAKRL